MKINDLPEPPRCALIVGHPGHELRILGWVKRMQPIVVALTDGSGHIGQSRLEISRKFLGEAGATPSRLYGMSSDREIYSKILEQDHLFFLGLAESVANLLIDQSTEFVAGDAIEGYNPSHDLCRLIIDRAVRLASNERGQIIKNYAFPLVGDPSLGGYFENNMTIKLSSDELTFKLSESQRYIEKTGGVLASEVAISVTNYGKAAFGTEVFHVEDSSAALANFEQEQPYYELYGEQQVKAGFYKQAIKYREHIAPLARRLLQ
ncbi:hypothetical protein MGMO_70c00250 [Methyloglobulus morosus KoM1]|uniref:Uncharacterized protein n=1 Tax=Methyloglobulus morosus KoM1 TaxID=1116472 RepID=V5BFS4_9GAMM|nr:hypothetical protein [Methyloglobulus morosus]ESS72130.1 hypothetical protein MGMO_70c00250 [Methyloglobulus morosus KoM1]